MLPMPNSRYIFQSISKFQQASSTMQRPSQKHLPENVYILRATLFEKLGGFNIEYTKEHTLFKNVAILDFESICVPSEKLKQTENIT